MGNEVGKAAAVSLSSDMAKGLMAGIAESRSSTSIAGGKPLLRLLKSGSWVFGPADEAVQEGSQWAINPLSIMHGYSCWSNHPGNAKNELLGEVMVPISERKPVKPDPIQGFAWNEQRVFELRCVLGDDEGTECTYKTSSVGGMRACDGFFAALIKQLADNPQYPVGIVQLEVDSYQHNKWGETFTPIIEVVDWADMGGGFMPDADPVAAVPGGNGGAGAAEAAPAQAPQQSAKPPLQRAGAVPKRQRPAVRV